MRGLPKDLAETVAGHLVMAGQLIDEDPELAYAHAEAARRRVARLPIVREAAAETAYAAGHYDVALSEFRALRRMTGTQDYLPVMADCERALGRPHNALKLAKEAERIELDPALRIEMIIVEAGARQDLGQDPEARRILDRAVNVGHRRRPGWRCPPPGCTTRTRRRCTRPGRTTEARRWFASAADLDHDQETDAQQRVDELDGFLIDFDDDDEPERGVSGPPPAVIDAYDAALFDLDGVVYLGPVAVAGAADGIARLRGRGTKVGFVTNNAARPPAAVAEHLRELAIPAATGRRGHLGPGRGPPGAEPVRAPARRC